MCASTTPTDANGTWTPAQPLTDEQRAQRAQAAYDAGEAPGGPLGGVMSEIAGVPGTAVKPDGSSGAREQHVNPAMTPPMQARITQTLRDTIHNDRADADARKLASMPRKSATQAQAPGRGGVNAAVGGGGPSTLLTGGTASDALVGKKSAVGKTSLLSG